MSNLTVSYVSNTPAGTPAGAPAAAADAAGPLGFLAALVDQLLADGEKAVTAKAGATVGVAGLLGAAMSSSAEVAALGPTVDPLAEHSAAPGADAQAIAQIIQTLLGHASPPEDTEPEPDPATPSGLPADLQQILAALGLNGSAATTPAAAPSPTAVPADLLRLSTQLGQIAAELTATAPGLAQKLDAVATRLVTADGGADFLAKLQTALGQSDGTALDKLVQSLIDAKPAAPAAPQLAAPVLSAPVAPKQPRSAVTEVKAAPPEPVLVAADSAQKPAAVAAPTAAAKDAPVEIAAEAKVAAGVAEPAKADPSPQPAQLPTAPAAQQVRPLPAVYQPVANPINMGQMAFEMVRQVHQGTSRFTIRLDPPEMGRVDVRMQVDANGTVNARLTVDRAETLDLFQRDRQSLERALAQAGLDAGKTNLEFSLRQQNHNPFGGMMGGDQQQQHPGHGGAGRFAAAGNDDAAMPAVTLYRGTASAAGINIFA